ncbi:hypothetical protein Tco_0154788 [Tanacetum coccineum]
MADLNDDISVIEEIPAQPKADVFEPNVNGHAEPEVVVYVTAQDDEVVNANSHEDPRLYQRSLSNCSDTAKHDDDEEVTTVVLSLDHMAYQDRYCTDCVLTFTSSCIKIEGSFLDDDEEPFRLQWGIKDILYIKFHWYQLVNTDPNDAYLVKGYGVCDAWTRSAIASRQAHSIPVHEEVKGGLNSWL